MNLLHNPSVGALLLRIALAAVLLSHSVYLKLVVFTLPGTASFFSSIERGVHATEFGLTWKMNALLP